ncbi:hypothetical protein KQX54_004415 [Cotesia glomerata]|uniref:Ionotropic glutamate receptor L-glutamate and glycine-binding domain-containing protein n=1 Tax=Cotesia glomerata TaxID=32391 RepID=A0AAV7HSA0_COTGL|nr:hypothetical protein KQX54_004415 [Cotesia glomerata]
MVIDDTIDYTSELLNVTLYGYSSVNVISRSARWSLSENYLFPRRFINVSRIEEMNHQSGIVDLEGRELQVAAFFNPPLCYLLTSVNRTVNGIDGQFFTAPDIPRDPMVTLESLWNQRQSGNSLKIYWFQYVSRIENEIDGIETKLFVIIAERLNFTWQIRKPNHHYRFGRPNGTHWNGGMIGQLFRNEIDIAFSGIWLKHDQYRFVNLTKPWHQLFINYLVPRPKHKFSFWALTRPLTPGVWLAIFGMILLHSLNVCAKAWINPHAETRIDQLDQFILKNLTWGRESPMPKFDDYFNLNDKYGSQFPKKFQLEKSQEERHEKIIQGNYAIIGRMIDSIFFPENDISSDDLQNYRVMKQSVSDYYVSFAVKPWLIKSFDKVILWMRETGIVTYHIKDVIYRKTSKSLRQVLVEYDIVTETTHALELLPLSAAFAFLFFGLFISSIKRISLAAIKIPVLV